MPAEFRTEKDTLNRNLMERVAIGDMLRRRARDSGNREALVEFIDGNRVALTYREFNACVNQLVRGLRSKGLHQGDRLALMASNRIDFLTVAFACYKAGLVLVPINFLQNPEDIRYNFEHAEVKAVIYEQAQESIAIACCQGLDNIQLKVVIDGEAGQADANLARLIEGFDSGEIEDIVICDRDGAQLLYTSGTTSRPKGVETSHLALYFASLSNPLSMNFGRFHAHLVVLPVFHSAALCLCLCTLQTGGKLVLQQSFDPTAVVDLLESEKIECTALLPMMWRALLNVPDLSARDFSHLRSGIYAMAPMDSGSLKKLREAFDCELHLASGQTEFSPAACLHYDSTPTEFGEGNYWGVPTIATDQAILDEKGNELPPGQQGEICWRGPQVMSRYLNNAEATDEVSQFGWHHSGDLGMIDSEGQLLFVDRKKDMIKSGGENVPSCRVEQVLLGIPGVIQAAVFGVPHPRWSEAVCAALQLAPGAALEEEQVIAHCKQHLGRFQVPKRVLFVEALPLTGTGKVRKTQLRQQYAELFSEETTA